MSCWAHRLIHCPETLKYMNGGVAFYRRWYLYLEDSFPFSTSWQGGLYSFFFGAQVTVLTHFVIRILRHVIVKSVNRHSHHWVYPTVLSPSTQVVLLLLSTSAWLHNSHTWNPYKHNSQKKPSSTTLPAAWSGAVLQLPTGPQSLERK